MANEILYSGHGNLRLSVATLPMALAQLEILLYDNADLRDMCVYKGDARGAGSLAIKHFQISVADAMGAVTEGTAVTNTDITDGTYTLTMAAQALRHEITDHMRSTGQMPDIAFLAMKMSIAFRLRFTDLIAALFASVSASVNSTGVLMDVDDFFDGMADLRAAYATGPFALTHTATNINNFINDLRGEGGPIAQWKEATQEVMQLWGGAGYQGSFAGVGIYLSDSCPSSGGDKVGCMFGMGAFSWQAMSAPDFSDNPNIVTIPEFPVYVEIDRTADLLTSGVQGNVFLGVGIAENARATKMINLA